MDCASRLDVCRAICCKLPFALSRQDIKEGIIHWEFGRPYLIAPKDDGYCVHLDRNTFHCTVREHRPLPCRGFGCLDNEKWKVWVDYHGKIKLVLMDMMMPIMDGSTSIRELHKINPELKIIAVSGLTEKDKLAKVYETYIHAFLTKPYTTEKLLNTIYDVMNTK